MKVTFTPFGCFELTKRKEKGNQTFCIPFYGKKKKKKRLIEETKSCIRLSRMVEKKISSPTFSHQPNRDLANIYIYI